MDGKTEELLRELLKKLNESKTVIDIDDAKKFEDSLARLNKITMQNTTTWGGMIKQTTGLTKQVKDLSADLETLDEEIEKLSEATDNESRQKKEQLQLARENMRQVQNENEKRKANIAGITAFSKSMAGTIGVVGSAMGSLAKQLQAGGDAFTMAGTIFNAGIDVANTGVQAAASGMSAAGGVLQNSTNPKLKMLGAASSFAAPLISGLGNAAAQSAKFLVDFLVVEAKKLTEAFGKMSNSGAMFAGGMGEMSQIAHGAGLSVKQFSEIVARNSESLGQSGMGVAEGAKQIGRVANDLKKSGVRDQLMNLGYSVEEQADLIAQTTANMRRSAGGKSSDSEIAAQTAKYAENLRTIAAITGEDAKKKVAQAQEQNQILAFQQELAKKTPEQRAQIDAAMATMTEQEKKNFRDRVVLGTVVNQEGAIYEAQIKGAREKGESALKLFNNNELTAKKNSELNAQYGDQIKDSVLQQQAFGKAAYVAGGQLNDVAKAQLDALNQSNTYTKDAVKNGEQSVEDQKNTHDKTTDNLNKAQLAAQDMAVQIEDIAQKQLPRFGEAVKNVIDHINKELGTKSAEGEQGFWDKYGGKIKAAGMGALTGAEAGGMVGGAAGTVAVPGIGTVAGGTVGAVVGGIAGALTGWFGEKDGKSLGGLSSGPASGYLEKLHGTELIIPTRDGALDTSSIGYQELMKTMDTSSKMAGGAIKIPKTDAQDLMQSIMPGMKMPTVSPTGISGMNDMLGSVSDMFKSSPITKIGEGLFDNVEKMLGGDNQTEKLGGLTDKIDQLISTMEKKNSEVTGNMDKVAQMTGMSNPAMDMASTFADMKDMMNKQLEKHEEMIGHMRDHKDISDKLLRVTM